MNEVTQKRKQNFITMGFDPLFKKMFGDTNYTNKAAAVIGLFLNIPYNEVKDRVEILNNQKIKKSKNEKYQEQDILVHVKLISGNQYVNLEANIHGYTQLLIDRNTGYIASTLSRQLDKGQGYEYLEPVLQINFNESSTKIQTNNTKPIDEYMLRNEEGRVLTNMLKIINIDIDKCYNLWYNGDIEKFTSCEQNIIKIGALHKIENEEEFRKCLGEIEMDEEVKNKIQHDMNEYQQDTELAMVYNKKKHEEFVRRAHEIELEQTRKELDVFQQQIDRDKQQIDKDKQQIDKDKQQIDRDKQQLLKEKQNIKEAQEQLKKEQIEFAKNLISSNISMEEISKMTILTIEEINKIKNEVIN